MKRKLFIVLAVLFLYVSPASALIEFNDGLTHDIDYEINDEVWVDSQAPGMQTTVNWLEGASIPYPYQLQAYEDSRINISGGSISYDLRAYDSSQVTMSGGLVGLDLRAWDNSQVTMSGGSIRNYLYAHDSSQVTMSGGLVDWGVYASGSSQVTVSGGSTTGGGLITYGSSQLTLSGGKIGGDLIAEGSGILTIHGVDFAVDGTPFGYGEVTSILGGWWFNEPHRHLTGILSSGDLLDNDIFIGQDAKIILTIPEPATLLLLGLGAVIMRKRK